MLRPCRTPLRVVRSHSWRFRLRLRAEHRQLAPFFRRHTWRGGGRTVYTGARELAGRACGVVGRRRNASAARYAIADVGYQVARLGHGPGAGGLDDQRSTCRVFVRTDGVALHGSDERGGASHDARRTLPACAHGLGVGDCTHGLSADTYGPPDVTSDPVGRPHGAAACTHGASGTRGRPRADRYGPSATSYDPFVVTSRGAYCVHRGRKAPTRLPCGYRARDLRPTTLDVPCMHPRPMR